MEPEVEEIEKSFSSIVFEAMPATILTSSLTIYITAIFSTFFIYGLKIYDFVLIVLVSWMFIFNPFAGLVISFIIAIILSFIICPVLVFFIDVIKKNGWQRKHSANVLFGIITGNIAVASHVIIFSKFDFDILTKSMADIAILGTFSGIIGIYMFLYLRKKMKIFEV